MLTISFYEMTDPLFTFNLANLFFRLRGRGEATLWEFCWPRVLQSSDVNSSASLDIWARETLVRGRKIRGAPAREVISKYCLKIVAPLSDPSIDGLDARFLSDFPHRMIIWGTQTVQNWHSIISATVNSALIALKVYVFSTLCAQWNVLCICICISSGLE